MKDLISMEEYATIKEVINDCPQCGASENYRLRFKYPDEGRMLCIKCQNKNARAAEEAEAAADIELTHGEVVLLKNALDSYIHTEKNCAGGVAGEYQTLSYKLGEYLHG